MAAELLGGAALGAGTSELLRGIIRVLKDVKDKDKNLSLLERHLFRLEPCVEEVSSTIKRQDGHPARIWLNDLQRELQAARELMASLRNTSTGPVLHARLSRKLVPINVRVSELMHDAVVTSWASTLSTVNNLTQVRAEDRMVLDDIKATQELSYLKQDENWSWLEQNLGQQEQVGGTQDQVWAGQSRILRKMEKVCGKLEKASGKLEQFLKQQEQVRKEEETFRRLVLQAISSQTSNMRAIESESAASETSKEKVKARHLDKGIRAFVRKLMGKFSSSADRAVYQYQAIPWKELCLATNEFDNRNIIGRGAFGIVYRGFLRGEDVAVKRLLQTPDHDAASKAELLVNLKISKHPNLVEFKGACCQGEDICIVYELLEHGDLHGLLWPERNIVQAREGEVGPARIRTWNITKKIAQGVAKGLDYLHRGLSSNRQIFHLDLKPRNILLTRDFSPKLADFGNCQLYTPGRTFEVTTVKGGTLGYMAPEILQGYLPNTKMDVYSFGMVLMQLVSGRELNDKEVKPSFVQWARNLIEMGDMDTVIDKHLFDSVQLGFEDNLVRNLRKMLRIARDCTEQSPDRRPEMTDILRVLADLEDVQEWFPFS